MAGKSQIHEEPPAETTLAAPPFVESLFRRIEDLEARMNQTPSNSSLPPASRHPRAKPPSTRAKSKRKRPGAMREVLLELGSPTADDDHAGGIS